VTTVTACLVTLAAASSGLYALAWALVHGWAAWHRRQSPITDAATSGVSVLKPLCGVDEDLERNLASFFRLEHEPLQLVFGAADPADPALELVRRLARRHPGRDVAIIVGADDSAASPKVGHDVGRVLPCFADPGVGMVHQPVVGVGEATLAAAVENLHYTEFAGFLSIAATVLTGQHAVNAKGQWVRRAALAEIGDFAGVRDHGADDYMLSRLVLARGWRLRLAPVPVETVQTAWSWRKAALRHLRHSSLRRRMVPWAYPLELLLNPVPWAVALLATDLAALALPLVALKMAIEVSAARLLRGRPLAWRHAAAIPLKDLLYFTGWFASFAVRTVAWRDRVYAIGPGGRLEPLDPAPTVDLTARSAA
jgi:ceramide glucosyltransferase